MEEKCGNCKFWQEQTLKCRRFLPGSNSEGEYQPGSTATDWCGEHQPKGKPMGKPMGPESTASAGGDIKVN